MAGLLHAGFVWLQRGSTVAAVAAVLMVSSIGGASAAAPARPAATHGSQGARGTSLMGGKHVSTLSTLAKAKASNRRVVVPHRQAAHMPNAHAEPAAAKPVIAGSPAIGSSQPAAGAPIANAPVTGTITGVNENETGSTIPPDPTMAAGPMQIVIATNGRIKAFNKVGTLVPNSSMSLGQFYSQLSGAADGVFDPKLAYDPYINRFWALAVSEHTSTGGGDTNRSTILIAISDTSDVTQGWTFFQQNAVLNGNSDSGRWCDYPQLGFDSQAVYFTCNMFPFSALIPIPYSKVRILLKTEFTGAGCCTWWDQWGFSEGFLGLIPSFTIQPAKMYGAVNSDGEWMIDAHTTCIGPCSDLEVFHITNAQNCCNNSSGPNFNQTGHGVGNFPGPNGGRQPGTSTRIDTGDTRLLYAIWQNGHLSTGQDQSNGGDESVSFTELDVSGGLGSINTVQDWQMTDSGVDYYYPAVDTNAAGDKAMVFSRSSPSEFVGTRYVTIPRSSTCHNCTGGQVVLANGDSTYVQIDTVNPGNRNRWGDYFGAAADPDGKGIWLHGEFAAASGQWSTVVGLAYETIENDLGLSGVPANIVVNATSPAGAVVNYAMPAATDEAGDNPAPTVSCNPASGSTFPIGTTTVTCTAFSADDIPSTVSKSFTVTVNDTDLGLAGVPANITVNATSTSGAVVTYPAPTAIDEADIPAATAACAPASGSTFPIGTTTVTCTATSADDSPSTVSQTFTVTVNDTDLGITGIPANITSDVNNPFGAAVTYALPTAVDEAGDVPAPTVSCTPASGSTFPLGTTTVVCTATSADDNPSSVSGSFTVTVVATPAGITNVVNQLLAAGCIDNAGIANALDAKLAAAQAAIAAGNFKEAINILNAFIHQVEAQNAKHIHATCTINGMTFSPAAALIADAQSLINSLMAMAAPMRPI